MATTLIRNQITFFDTLSRMVTDGHADLSTNEPTLLCTEMRGRIEVENNVMGVRANRWTIVTSRRMAMVGGAGGRTWGWLLSHALAQTQNSSSEDPDVFQFDRLLLFGADGVKYSWLRRILLRFHGDLTPFPGSAFSHQRRPLSQQLRHCRHAIQDDRRSAGLDIRSDHRAGSVLGPNSHQGLSRIRQAKLEDAALGSPLEKKTGGAFVSGAHAAQNLLRASSFDAAQMSEAFFDDSEGGGGSRRVAVGGQDFRRVSVHFDHAPFHPLVVAAWPAADAESAPAAKQRRFVFPRRRVESPYVGL